MTESEYHHTFVEEARAYGLTENEIQGLEPLGTNSLEGLKAFRQGLIEAGAVVVNPDFSEELRTMPEYMVGVQVVGIASSPRKMEAA